jgi:cell division septation protein DedD
VKLVQQQRIIGSILLLLLISFTAYLLIINASPTISSDAEKTPAVSQKLDGLISPQVTPAIESAQTELVSEVDAPAVEAEEPVAKVEQTVDNNTADDAELDKLELLLANSVEKPASVSAAPKPISPTNQSPKVAWVVQLASFSNKDYAQSFVKKLTKLGYSAHISESENKKGIIYRVRLAANPNKAEAEATAKKLTQQLKISPQVLKRQQ